MPPAYELLLLNTSIPQIQAAQSGDTYLCPRELAVVVNSATDAVRITQTGAGNAILVEDSANPDSTPFVVTAAGDVGIGTTPGVKLDIVGQGRVLYNTGATNTGDQSVVTVGAITSGAYASTYGAGLQFQVQNSGGGFAGSRIVSRLGADNNTANLVFQARNYGYTDSMTLDASGRLGIGETNPVTDIDILRASGDVSTRFRNGTGTGIVGVRSDNNFTELRAVSNHGIQFSTNNAERARITSGGYFKASNTGTYSNAGLFHEFYQTEDYTALLVRATNGSFTQSVLTVNGDRITTNSSYSLIDAYNGDLSGRFIVRDSGNAVNTNGSYGTISDQRLKQDIVDAGSQWDDLKAIRFRKYRMKADVAANPDAPALLGVVAQELEQTSPGLVETTADKDAEGNDLGTTTKSVKTSILLMKAAVALQEAMARIETLEAEVAALKGA